MAVSKKDVCGLDRCVLCRSCDPSWKDAISDARQVLHYKKGEVIFSEGKEVRGLYFVYSGAVKVHQSWGPENEFIIRIAVAGDVLGHRALGNASSSPVSATALAATTVCFITYEFLEVMLAVNPDVVHMLLLLYSSELQKAERRMRNLAMMPVKNRVADALLAIRDAVGADDQGYFSIPITRIDIGCYAGTTYEAVFRLFTEWTRDGVVSTAGKKIRIDDEKKMRSLVES